MREFKRFKKESGYRRIEDLIKGQMAELHLIIKSMNTYFDTNEKIKFVHELGNCYMKMGDFGKIIDLFKDCIQTTEKF